MTAASAGAEQRRDRPAGAAALLVVGIWGVSVPLTKVALDEIDPLAFTFVRYLGMIALGWTVLLARRARGLPLGLAGADLPRAALAGVLGYSAYIVLSTVGLARTTAFSTALLTSTAPLFAALLLRVLGLEAIGRRQIAGMLLALIGVLVFLAEKLHAAVPGAGAGDLLSLAGALCFAAYTVAQKPLLERYAVPVMMAHTCTIGAAPVLLLAWPAALAQDWSGVSAAAWGSVAWTIAVPVYLAWSIWAWVIGRVGVARTAVFMFLVPVAGGAVSRVLFGEAFDVPKLGGAVLILAGLALVRLPYAASTWATVGASPATVVRRMSRGWLSS